MAFRQSFSAQHSSSCPQKLKNDAKSMIQGTPGPRSIPNNMRWTWETFLDIRSESAQLHTTFTDAKPNCEGLKPTESENFISTDYTDRNGSLHGYIVTTYDNGDKIFQKQEGVSQTITNADGSKSSTLYAIVKYVGGTGKYKSIQGMARTTAAFDPVRTMSRLIPRVSIGSRNRVNLLTPE